MSEYINQNGRRIPVSHANAAQGIQRITAQRIKTQADIVFCIDATGSMEPCFEGVKKGLHVFADALQTAADVDYRLRLIGYRDRHDPTCGVKWDVSDFTTSIDEFRSQVSNLRPIGGGNSLPESALDALYLAINKSDWRVSGAHKTIVLLTDADTHPTLHSETYPLPDNDVRRVIQEFQTLKHVMLFIVAPEYPIYVKLEKAAKAAEREVIADFVPIEDDKYTGLKAVDWSSLMKLLGETVSVSSLNVGS